VIKRKEDVKTGAHKLSNVGFNLGSS